MAETGGGRIRRAAEGFRLAVTFLTLAPVGVRAGAEPARMAVWLPVVGALVGALAGAVRLAFDPLLGSGAASVLAVGVLIVSTGALHQDGLADWADGLGVRGDRARRLAVMREPQVGVFGMLAVLLWLALLLAAVAGLDGGEAAYALVVACALGRWSALAQAVLAEPARPEGLGAGFDVGRAQFALASAAAAALTLALESPPRALGALVAAGLTSLAVTAWARRSVGGRTGDTLGASVALVEVVVCLVILGFVR